MAKLYNLARMTTATAGTGTITLGSAVSGYLTFALAGVANGDVVSYGIKDGANSEVGTGTYTASGTTLSRTVTKSTNSDSAISLSGSAEVFITARSEDLVNYIGTDVGIGNSAPGAPLHVGAASMLSGVSNVVSARANTGSANVHGFAENSTYNLGASGLGINAYDAVSTFTGTQNYDHTVSFQSRPTYGSSGTITNIYGCYDAPVVNTGTATSTYGYYAANPTGTGTITTTYGFYAEALTKAATNYGFYTPFSNVYNAASLALITIGKSSSEYPAIGFNVRYSSSAATYKRSTADYAAEIQFGNNSGRIETFTAGTSTAGSSITWSQGPYVTNGGTSWTTASDVRMKCNIETLSVLGRIGDFRAVTFDWRNNSHHDIGVIAQELNEIFPELVDKDVSEQWGVHYDRLGAIALGGVAELIGLVKSLQAEVASLKAMLDK